MVNVDLNALEIGAVLMLVRNTRFRNRLVCCSDCVRSFSLVRNEKLQALHGSECSKSEGQL